LICSTTFFLFTLSSFLYLSFSEIFEAVQHLFFFHFHDFYLICIIIENFIINLEINEEKLAQMKKESVKHEKKLIGFHLNILFHPVDQVYNFSTICGAQILVHSMFIVKLIVPFKLSHYRHLR
jgi:hypothetical protein